MVHSSVALVEATNEEQTSTEVKLYEKDDDVDELDEEVMHEDKKPLSGKYLSAKNVTDHRWLNGNRSLSLLVYFWWLLMCYSAHTI